MDDSERDGRLDDESGRWRPVLPPGPADVALAYRGDAPPVDLLMLARVFEEGSKRGGVPGWHWRWGCLDNAPPVAAPSLWVLAQDPSGTAIASPDLGDASVFIGPAALWFAATPQARGLRVALHWEDAAAREQVADEVVPSPSIIEVSGRYTSCSGGFASVDLGLLMLGELAGSGVALQVMDTLCLERVREAGSRQRAAAAGALGAMVPKLVEAIALMEANIEETLQTDEIARLVGLSRRQLERLFKQHLGTVPSRYYVDIRLQRARKLLRETRHSLLQVGLMCGFSSGSHFSTTYSSVFGIAPREERQRVLLTIAR